MSLISGIEVEAIKIGDPHISRIDKIFAENGPKFLDWYASIYDNKTLSKVVQIESKIIILLC